MALKLTPGVAKATTTAGTRVALTTIAFPVTTIIIQAKNANTGTIYVGDSTVASTNGLQLKAGQVLTLTGDNRNEGQADELIPNDVYIDSSVDAEGVIWSYYAKR